jgi:hypothetical protein
MEENGQGAAAIKLAGGAGCRHLSGEGTRIETSQDRIAAEGAPLIARSETQQTSRRALFGVNLPINFCWAALTGPQNTQSMWAISARRWDLLVRFISSTATPEKPTRRLPRMPRLIRSLRSGRQCAENREDEKIAAAYSKCDAAVDARNGLSPIEFRELGVRGSPRGTLGLPSSRACGGRCPGGGLEFNDGRINPPTRRPKKWPLRTSL